MHDFKLKQDIEVVFLKALEFPKDVPATYERLHNLLPEHSQRRYFGISHPDRSGQIQYMAAAEVMPTDDLTSVDLDRFTIKKGRFSSTYIVNHFQDSQCIGNAFHNLLRHYQLDPMGYCLEMYKNYTDKDVHCMVRLTD